MLGSKCLVRSLSSMVNFISNTQFDTLKLPACLISRRFLRIKTRQKPRDFLTMLKTSGKTFTINMDFGQKFFPMPTETEMSLDGSSNNFDFVCRSLLHYEKMNGDMLVATKFTVPDKSDNWPEEMWNMNLGKIVYSIRNSRRYHLRRQELTVIGFNFNPPKRKYGYPLIEKALLHYKSLYGDLLVRSNFIISNESNSNEKWPPETVGMNLGNVVSKIRNKGSYKEMRDRLSNMGFQYSSQTLAGRASHHKRYSYDLIKIALLHYKSSHGTMLVPLHYVIPENSNDWPEEIWNMPLGDFVSTIRTGLRFEAHREELSSIGFDFKLQQKRYGYSLLKLSLQVAL